MAAVLEPGSGHAIGILGGGQLGRMLAVAAARLGFRTVVLDPDADCPAAQLASRHLACAYDDPAGLEEMAQACDVITYEFENVPVETAVRLGGEVPVFPPAGALETAQDRLIEKRHLAELGIATAPFEAVATMNELIAAHERLGADTVLKTRRLGYDGKGQLPLTGRIDGATANQAETLLAVPCVIEQRVELKSEISVIAARGLDGEIHCYDAARNVHEDGILVSSTVPADVRGEIEAHAQQITGRLLDSLDYVGVIGVEFFIANEDELLLNEFAPRVHNSGHWTEAACAISQFEQHIRAITGLPLGEPARHSDCLMKNLIGDEAKEASQWLTSAGAKLHLYGKTQIRPGRKMGHVTVLRHQSP